MTRQAEVRLCEWPGGCAHEVFWGEPYCYAHRKEAEGLIRPTFEQTRERTRRRRAERER